MTGVTRSQADEEHLSAPEVSTLRHELRTPINQIVGYCEMLLEDAEGAQHDARRHNLKSALAAVRDILHLIDTALPPAHDGIGRSDIFRLYETLKPPQRQILEAMSQLLREETSSPDQEFVSDVCRIRDAAERLLPTDRRRAEPTSAFVAPAAVEVSVRVAPNGPSSLSARILIVDDVDENRGVLERRLRREGHRVASAASGPEALDAIRDEPFDIVLLDVMMPGMDGYETLEKLKASPETRDISVIMISALDDIASIVRCIEHGAEDYLPKPFDPVLLRARISASLEKKVLREREKEYMRDVRQVAAAAVSVERGAYSSGALDAVGRRTDELGALARVFDSMAAGIRERENTLRTQIEQLREEIEDTGANPEEAITDGPGILGIGEVFASRYRVERAIGHGGMGMVYAADDLELGETVAIKTLRPELLTSDENAIERFRNEIRLARKMAHRNIVRTHDFGTADGVYFVTMELVEGTTLRSVLDRRGHLRPDAMLAIARQLAEALSCAHGEGIIHRDIKPQNLLLDAAGTLKVSDFGVARLAQRTSTLTQAGMVVGTPTYMAPEQLLEEDVDARSDLYSAGVVLYECLTGRPPFEAKSPISLIAKILQEKPPAPDTVNRDIPPAIAAIVMNLLARQVEQRIQSADALRQVLARIQ